jgi:tRNA A-37 threonylcarbamoyl transferase component Bud32
MKKVVIHPDYAFCADFIDRLPEIFHAEGETIFKARNELKFFDVQGLEFVVKSFKTPHFINQIAYSTLRASKAERAYSHALILIEKGISTPFPVAYIEIKRYGLLYNNFFVSVKSRFHREIREISDSPDIPETYPVLTDFARFTADLHQKGIFHKDYTPGNILFGKNEDRYDFEVVDLNRMKFCEVTMEMGCRNLRNLYFTKAQFAFIARQYAQLRGFDPDQCEKSVLKYAVLPNSKR